MGSAPCEVSLSLRSGELSASARNLPSRTCWIAVGMFANMLGVRREGVTEAAGKLQVDGVIQYSRGHIKVLASGKLEARVCECYQVVKQEFGRLLVYCGDVAFVAALRSCIKRAFADHGPVASRKNETRVGKSTLRR